MFDIVEYSKTFNCCGKQYLTQLEYIKTRYYTIVLTKDKQFKEKNYIKELYGKRENNWNDLNIIHYFWNLMSLMYRYQTRYYNQYLLNIITYDEVPNALWYRDEFNLECIRKTLKCIGIDILPLLSLIGLNYVIQIKDGIDYMAIVPNMTSRPDFWVR